jgi:esterase/lipase superfamily enzyme
MKNALRFVAVFFGFVLAIESANAQQLPVLSNDPRLGPICMGPMGPGPCATIQKYLLEQQNSQVNLQFKPQQLQVIANDPTQGPICNGPLGPGPCAAIQQYFLDRSGPTVPQPQTFGLPDTNSLSPQQLAIRCAQLANLDVSAFVGCAGQRMILSPDQQALLDCAVSSTTSQVFAACAAPKLGIRLSNMSQIAAQCAMKSSGKENEFLECTRSVSGGQSLMPAQPAVLACARDSNSDASTFASCSAKYLLGEQPSNEQMIALICAAQSRGDDNAMAACSGANLFNLQLNPEQQIVVQCVVSSGGVPYSAMGCMATRLTARELVKCKTDGLGGDRGCFGANNDLLGKTGWSARTLVQITSDSNSVVRNPDQIWGGENSFVRNPAQIWGGNNSVVKNPSQFWGGNNSIFNNPSKLLPPPVQVGSDGSKRICVPWCSLPDDVKALQAVYFATNRKIVDEAQLQASSFTASRSMQLRYGITVVSVPKNHVIGNVERPKFNYLRWSYNKETNADDFRISSITSLARGQLVDELRTNAESVLLFIHGYNVSFQDAIFKAAQIAYDANFEGSVLVFSWPSAGELLKYDYDRESAEFSSGDLLGVLRILTEEIERKRIYIVAHSLGNQVLVDALQQAALSKVNLNISELVMAAPDVDKDVFMKKAEEIRSVAKNITMYASSADKALLASDKKAWGARLGYIDAPEPNLAEGMETIDVTAVGEDMLGLGHSTFSGSRAVLDDIGRIIRSKVHLSPIDRSPTLQSKPNKEQVRYWLYPR